MENSQHQRTAEGGIMQKALANIFIVKEKFEFTSILKRRAKQYLDWWIAETAKAVEAELTSNYK